VISAHLSWSLAQTSRVLLSFDQQGWTSRQEVSAGRAHSAAWPTPPADLGNVLASNQWCVTDLLAAALLDRLGARPTLVGILVSDELDLTEIF